MRHLTLLAICAALAGCAASGAPGGDSSKLQVVAAENFWGSIASQLGGKRVQVTSIITNPASDPHDYEPSAQDARTLAEARLAIVNGIGYDPWASKLISANPVDGRVVLNVGDVVGIKAGGNPHRWYSPPDVQQMIDAITASYKKLDPKHASFYDSQRTEFETHALAQYKGLIASIKSRYSGVPVGASESIFEPLAESLGLKLMTPPGFMNAIKRGHRPDGERQVHRRPSDKPEADRAVGLQQPERDPRRAAADRTGAGEGRSGGHGHGDAHAGIGEL